MTLAYGFFAACAWLCLCAAPGAADGAHYPSPAAIWTEGDYVNFYFTHYNGNLALPHLRSPEGRRLFARLTDRANIERIADGASDAATKRRQLSIVLASVGATRAAYNGALIAGEPLAEELARLQIFLLDVLDARVRLAGAETARAAWKTSLLGLARSLAEDGAYSESQRANLAAALTARGQLFNTLLDDGEKSALADAVAALGQAATGRRFKAACGALAQTLRKS